jgi:hypothetical protein
MSTGTGTRIFTIGASHVTRIIGGLAECGIDVINLAKPGWTLSENTVTEIKLKLRNMNICQDNILLIDPLSNSVFCGTDLDGNHADPEKKDDHWHIPGELNVRSKSYLKNLLCSLKKITDVSPDSKIIMLAPVPRYITSRCCDNSDHFKNFADKGFQEELVDDLDKVSDLLTAWLEARDVPSLLVDYRAAAITPTAPLRELTVDGQSIWQPADPVHPVPALYAKLAEAIFSGLEELEVTSTAGAPKRARLESIVVRKATNPGTGSICKQSWSLGVLPAAKKEHSSAARGRGAPRGRG